METEKKKWEKEEKYSDETRAINVGGWGGGGGVVEGWGAHASELTL